MSGSKLTRIGKYEVTGMLGRGGMGRVYRAHDRQLGREVAIKTLTEGFVGDPQMLERFYREAAKTGVLKHANIVTVYDLGEQDGCPYIVMEYVAGDALDKVIQSNQPLTLAAKLSIVEQVCHALAYAHRNDVIHRDVKPANVILQPDGVVKLLDFGIACQEKRDRNLTQTGSVIGTIHYMAPERLKGRDFDGRSDIFSSGVMLYLLLTGHLPFPGDDYGAIQKVMHEPYPPLSTYLASYPAELETILSRSLAKEPLDRYASAEEMASEISNLGEQLKKDQVLEMFQQAEHMVEEEELTKAREILLKIAKIDPKHVGARQMMVLVQQSLAQKQRAAQIQQLRTQAEDALADRRYGDAIASLEQALKLDPSSSELIVALEVARQKKSRYEQVAGYLRRVEDARARHDFETAQAEIARAIELDKDDSRVRATYAALIRQLEEEARTRKSRKLLETARGEVNARHFTAAIKLLTEAEQLDPANPELISLFQTAKSGQEQEQRRRTIERLQNEMAMAATREDVARTLSMVQEALAKMPNEPTLLQFKLQLERQTDEYDLRRSVDETVQKCRALLETSPQEALQIVRDKLRVFPGNERLQVLLASIEQHVQRKSADEARTRYLTLVNEALNRRRYREAVRLLETCQAEGTFSDEMRGLLEFARHEAKREQRESTIETIINQAQSLMSQGSFEDAVKLLEPVAVNTGDLTLSNLLEKARSKRDELQRKIEAIASSLAEFLHEEQFDEGVAFLKAQPEAVLRHAAAQEALKALRSARDRSRRELQSIGMAYAYLDGGQMNEGWASLQSCLQTHPDSALLKKIVQSFLSRRKEHASRRVNVAIQKALDACSRGDVLFAKEALDGAASSVEYATPELQTKWKSLVNDVAKSSSNAGIGAKRPRAV